MRAAKRNYADFRADILKHKSSLTEASAPPSFCVSRLHCHVSPFYIQQMYEPPKHIIKAHTTQGKRAHLRSEEAEGKRVRMQMPPQPRQMLPEEKPRKNKLRKRFDLKASGANNARTYSRCSSHSTGSRCCCRLDLRQRNCCCCCCCCLSKVCIT